MASEIDICNAALSHLGDAATIASIDPPEGSVQAEHCAVFYPLARNALLEEHNWNFATKRARLAEVDNLWPQWLRCYAAPSDALRILAVLPGDATGDWSALPQLGAASAYAPQPFVCELDAEDRDVIYTNAAPGAVVHYTKLVTDTARFSPLFVMTLSWRLAALLAGPILKGDVGAAEAKRCEQMAQGYLSKARDSDVGQRRVAPLEHVVDWMAGR